MIRLVSGELEKLGAKTVTGPKFCSMFAKLSLCSLVRTLGIGTRILSREENSYCRGVSSFYS